jgi:flavin reductase (DIM6/NTAB) family NADH-FMN oxidoreductase RutF
MFYSSQDLPKGLFKASIIPRPIAWVSTISPEGITNLAPFSYFQAISDVPPMIMFVVTSKDKDMPKKDTLVNIEATKEFVINIVPESALDLMDLSSENLPYNESEIEKFGIPTKTSHLIKPPSIALSPINLECVLCQIIDVPESTRGNKMVIGKVVGMSVDETIMNDGKIRPEKFHPVCRLGYHSYSVIDRVIEKKRSAILT